MVAAGALDPLVELVRTGNAVGKQDAAEALAS